MSRLAQGALLLAQHGGEIVLENGVDIQTEPGEHLAVKQSGRVGLQWPVGAVDELEPVDTALQGAPDQVLPHAVAPVRMELVVQIVGRAAGCNLGDQLRRAFDVVVIAQPRLTARRRGR